MKRLYISLIVIMIPAGIFSFIYDKSGELEESVVRMADFKCSGEISARINGSFVKIERFASALAPEAAAKVFAEKNSVPVLMKGNAGGYAAVFKALLPDTAAEDMDIYVTEKNGCLTAAGIAQAQKGSLIVIVTMPQAYRTDKAVFFDDEISHPKGVKITESVELLSGNQTIHFANTYTLAADSAGTVLSDYRARLEKDKWVIGAAYLGADNGYFLAQKKNRSVSITVNYNGEGGNYTVCVIG